MHFNFNRLEAIELDLSLQKKKKRKIACYFVLWEFVNFMKIKRFFALLLTCYTLNSTQQARWAILRHSAL